MPKVQFDSISLPYLLILPQMAIVAVFFFWPAAQAIYQSFLLEDPFGISSQFVWFDNYREVLNSSRYLTSAIFTVIFSAAVAFMSLSVALLLAVKADGILKAQGPYKTLLMWVYAVAPPVAGLLGTMLFNQHIGPLYAFLNDAGWPFQPTVDAFDAGAMLIVVASWKQISVNFLFFLAGLQSIPRTVREAAMIDCSSGATRFWTITFPLLAPTSFFLLIINIVYAFFETFGIIDTMTEGRPGGGTATLVYKVYQDGFLGADLGGSSAQSVILMIIVLVLTIAQFRLLDRRIHYS